MHIVSIEYCELPGSVSIFYFKKKNVSLEGKRKKKGYHKLVSTQGRGDGEEEWKRRCLIFRSRFIMCPRKILLPDFYYYLIGHKHNNITGKSLCSQKQHYSINGKKIQTIIKDKPISTYQK